MKKIRLEILPYIEREDIGEIEVSLEISEKEYKKYEKMSKLKKIEYIKSNATVRVTDFDVEYSFGIDEVSVEEIEEIEKIDYKAKYEKCINVIRRFDADIIEIYGL